MLRMMKAPNAGCDSRAFALVQVVIGAMKQQ